MSCHGSDVFFLDAFPAFASGRADTLVESTECRTALMARARFHRILDDFAALLAQETRHPFHVLAGIAQFFGVTIKNFQGESINFNRVGYLDLIFLGDSLASGKFPDASLSFAAKSRPGERPSILAIFARRSSAVMLRRDTFVAISTPPSLVAPLNAPVAQTVTSTPRMLCGSTMATFS